MLMKELTTFQEIFVRCHTDSTQLLKLEQFVYAHHHNNSYNFLANQFDDYHGI